MTVEELLMQCHRLHRAGLGKKQILISDDDEGNGFHSLYYAFTTDENELKSFANSGLFHDNNDPADVVILG